MRIRHPLTATLVAAALALSACGGSSSDGGSAGGGAASTQASSDTSGRSEVEIVDFAYGPAELEVSSGDTVTFTNSDDAAHTATSESDDPAEFDTGDIDGGDSAEVTFEEVGDYAYYCSIHDYMTGTIRVVG
jgi:plastocyanin